VLRNNCWVWGARAQASLQVLGQGEHSDSLSLSARSGIELKAKHKKSKGIDYNAEVAFEKRAPQGFYDTGEEAQVSKV
jgi:hypothetical protein